MNAELKAILNLAFDIVGLGDDVAHGRYLSVIGDMIKITGASPSVIAGFKDADDELKMLIGAENESDLIAFIEQKFSGIGSEKAQQILAISLRLVKDLVVVVQDGIVLKGSL